MPIQVLPSEIFDLLVDTLASTIQEDPQSEAALLACTLVNRQFYRQASPYIFSSIFISARDTQGRSQRRLNALLDIINANPYITRHIRTLTVEVQTCTESLPAVLRQLDHLQEFSWVDSQQHSMIPSYSHPPAINIQAISSIKNFCNLTALHFYGFINLPLSLFSECGCLESLTLIWVRFAEVERNAPGSFLLSLKRLEISGVLVGRDTEAVRIILLRVAPTLTTLILRNTYIDDHLFPNPNSTIFPSLRSIKMYCAISPGDSLPSFISIFLNYSAPLANQIQIEIESDIEEYFEPEPSGACFIFDVAEGWSPIDQILSSPKYPALKTLDLTFSQRHPPLTSEVAVQTLLNKILPAVSSFGHAEIKIRTPSSEPSLVSSRMEIHFVF